MNPPSNPRSASRGYVGRKRGMLVSVVCLLTVSIASCGRKTTPHRVEVTTTNFTGPPFLNSKKIQTFGVGLGDSEVQAREAIHRAGLAWEMPLPGNPLLSARIRDARGRGLMEIHTSPPPGGPPGKFNYFLHRLWEAPRYDYSVDLIAWDSDMISRLAGDNALLLASAFMLPDSPLRRHLLGGDGVRTSQLQMGGGVEFVTYAYPEQGFKITGTWRNRGWVPGSLSFELVPPKQ